MPGMKLAWEDAERIGQTVANAMLERFGREAALQLSLPIAVVMQTLEDAGALVPIVGDDSVRTESEDDEYTIWALNDDGSDWVECWSGAGFVAATAKMIDAQKTHTTVSLTWTR